MLDILMITYNRADYTKLALTRLLHSCSPEMRVWVWHNGSHQPTLDIVKDLRSHPRFFKLHVSETNEKLRGPTNWFWTQSSADYLSKVDDDCLLPDGWGEKLIDAHNANAQFGVIGSWRFYEEDFAPEIAFRKIRKFSGGHQLMMNCWVQGSGYVMKRACLKRDGQISPSESFSSFCIRVASYGWQNGWYFPFIHEEHMDDPRSSYCLIKSDEEFLAQRPLSAINDNVTTLAEWAQRVKYMARSAQAANPDPRTYIGWRGFLRKANNRARRLFGRRESWRHTARNAMKLDVVKKQYMLET